MVSVGSSDRVRRVTVTVSETFALVGTVLLVVAVAGEIFARQLGARYAVAQQGQARDGWRLDSSG